MLKVVQFKFLRCKIFNRNESELVSAAPIGDIRL